MAWGDDERYRSDLAREREAHRNTQEELDVALQAVTNLRNDLAEVLKALEAINKIRCSIVETQSLNWSAHIYPLVAALDAAGMKGK